MKISFFIFFFYPLVLFASEINATSSVEVKPRIILVSEFNTVSFTWEEIGFKNKNLFSDSVLNSWMRWVGDHHQKEKNLIGVCPESCIKFYEWIQGPILGEGHVQEDGFSPHWLKVSFNIRKIYSDLKINEYTYEWEGSAVLLDGKTKMIREAFQIFPEKRTWRGYSQKELNSALATFVYHTALDSINKIINKFKNLQLQEKVEPKEIKRIIVRGHKQMLDVINLMGLVKNVGVQNIELEFFNTNEAQLICAYGGEEKTFTDLLSQLKELKSTNNYKVVNESDGNHYILKLSLE
jgi:hypothetical protein